MGICCVGKRKFQPVAVQQLMALLRELRVDQPLRSTEYGEVLAGQGSLTRIKGQYSAGRTGPDRAVIGAVANDCDCRGDRPGIKGIGTLSKPVGLNSQETQVSKRDHLDHQQQQTRQDSTFDMADSGGGRGGKAAGQGIEKRV